MNLRESRTVCSQPAGTTEVPGRRTSVCTNADIGSEPGERRRLGVDTHRNGESSRKHARGLGALQPRYTCVGILPQSGQCCLCPGWEGVSSACTGCSGAQQPRYTCADTLFVRRKRLCASADEQETPFAHTGCSGALQPRYTHEGALLRAKRLDWDNVHALEWGVSTAHARCLGTLQPQRTL